MQIITAHIYIHLAFVFSLTVYVSQLYPNFVTFDMTPVTFFLETAFKQLSTFEPYYLFETIHVTTLLIYKIEQFNSIYSFISAIY